MFASCSQNLAVQYFSSMRSNNWDTIYHFDSNEPASASMTQADTCALLIANLIRNSILVPGQKISEHKLGKQLGYGISPLRAALNRLSEIGIVRRSPKSGTYIQTLSDEDYLALLDLRIALESAGISGALNYITSDQIKQLKLRAKELDALKSPLAKDMETFRFYSDRDVHFHLQIASISRNRFILKSLQDNFLLAVSYRSRISENQERSATSASVPHQEIVEALSSKNPKQCDDVIRRHISINKKAIFERTKEAGMP